MSSNGVPSNNLALKEMQNLIASKYKNFFSVRNLEIYFGIQVILNAAEFELRTSYMQKGT